MPVRPTLLPLEVRAVPAGLDFDGLDFYQPPTRMLWSPAGLLGPATPGDPADVALDFVRGHADQLHLTSADVRQPLVTGEHTDTAAGITHVYFTQTYHGLPVTNAVMNVSLTAANEVIVVGSSFVGGLVEPITLGTGSPAPTLTAGEAVLAAVGSLGLAASAPPGVRSAGDSGTSVVLLAPDLSLDDIPASLAYVATPSGVRLAWTAVLRTPDGGHWFHLGIDAATGDVLSAADWGGESVAAYTVYPLPTRDPLDGPRTVAVGREDPVASPFGWHDTDGVPGAEFTITRGNNVFAREDADANNTGGFSPDGGAALVFDFPIDFSQPASANRSASLTNLFYLSNVAHDVFYKYGFTESAGNFQVSNHGNGGAGGDAVIADGLDGSGTNNANFATPPDGQAPRMQMFLWNVAAGYAVVSNTPGVAGPSAVAGAVFGPQVFNVTANAVVADPALAGGPITNDVAGKIAIVDRGGNVNFTVKVKTAQDAGAVGVIVVQNANDPPFRMGGTDDGITIPAVMISQADGDALKLVIANGTVNLTLVGTDAGQRDGSFDAGVVIHEYGHGVTNRLTGGPANASALQATQSGGMGEGWSDYFALAFTQKAADTAATPRTLAAYSSGNAAGIRRQPYSVDLAVNPVTFQAYNDDSSKSVHNTGEVWASALWDLHWLLIDRYGYDADLSTGYTGVGAGAAGNKLALQLALDGLKLQPANPTFVQARDAILAADVARTGGANQTDIWTAFARRGLGFGASTASASSGTVALSSVVPSDLARVVSDQTATPVGGAFDVRFSRAMDPTSFGLPGGIVSFTGPGGTDRTAAITGFSWDATNTRLTLTLDASAPVGNYSLVLAPTLTDATGGPIDQDGDGTGGEVPDDRPTVGVVVFAPLVVTTTADELDATYDPADLSLREAVALADLHRGADAIGFAADLAGSAITLTSGLPFADATGPTTITGPANPVTVRGNGLTRLFEVQTDASLAASGLVLTGGRGDFGANLSNAGTLTLTDVTLSAGVSTGDVAGGLYNAGTATLTRVTVSGNTGGGIVNVGTLALVNATVSGNTAAFSGGGIANGGTLTATNATITANRSDGANDGGDDAGGGLYLFDGGTATLRNTIVADNFRGSGTTTPDDIDAADGTVDLVNSTNNLIGAGGSGGLVNGVNGNIVGVSSPRLGPLQANGGPSATHVPRPESPAVNAAGTGPSADQRGIARPVGSGPDVGAVEAVFAVDPLADRTIVEDGVLQASLDVHDFPADAAIAVASDNPGLVPPSGISVTGNGRVRTLRVTPGANSFGSATITVTVGVGGPAAVAVSFVLTVTPVNDAPVLTGIGRLPGIAADTADPPGAALSVVFASAGFTDLDPGGRLVGFAVVGDLSTSGQGVWEYSTDGDHWFRVGSVNDSGAGLALSTATRVRFHPALGYAGGVGSLVVRALDDTHSGGFSTTAGGSESRVLVNTVARGTPSPIAAASNVITTSVGEPAPNPTPPPQPPLPPTPTPQPTPTPTPEPTPLPPLSPPALTFATGTAAPGANTATMFRANGSPAFTVTPFPDAPGVAVRVAAADVTGDGTADLIAATGPGTSVRVVVFDGVTRQVVRSYAPFEDTFTGGAFVAAADLDGDGFADVAVSPDESGGPRVTVFSGRTGDRLTDFFGIDDPTFRGGARTAFGDVSGDGVPDLLVAAGFGGGPRVAVWDGTSLTPGGTPRRLVDDFFLFEETLRNGAFIAAGDVNGDGFADVVGGGGPSGGPRVFAVDGRRLLDAGATDFAPLANFFAGDPENRDGARVAVKNLDGDDHLDLIAAVAGPGGPAVFGYRSAVRTADGSPAVAFGPDAFPDLAGGVFVG